jgi:hypothetical protein
VEPASTNDQQIVYALENGSGLGGRGKAHALERPWIGDDRRASTARPEGEATDRGGLWIVA